TQNFIGAYYVYLFIALAWAGLAAFVVMLVLFRRWRMSDFTVTILILLGTTIAARILFFSFLEATWWMAGYERYLWPVMPLASCFFILTIFQAIKVARRKTGESSLGA
ncbi:MAG TPA: hypothetical protein VH252_07965, partial [Chthoniobacterales bacterium]|nr:hypothetical protein [Chthoniobacterales bacterium]